MLLALFPARNGEAFTARKKTRLALDKKSFFRKKGGDFTAKKRGYAPARNGEALLLKKGHAPS